MPDMKRTPRTVALMALGIALAVTPAVSPAPAAAVKSLNAAALRKKLNRLLVKAGVKSGAVVRDAKSGKTLVQIRGRATRPLASNTKLFTTAAALSELGPLRTTVLANGPPDGNGDITGDLFLVGGGDPALDAVAMRALATQVTNAGVDHISGAIVGDETLFDDLRGGPTTGFAFDPEIGGALSALTFDRGRAIDGGGIISDPARGAAVRFDDALEERAVTIPNVPHEGTAPGSATTVLGSISTPVSSAVRTTNKKSDNFFAEILAKGLGAEATDEGSTAAGAAAIEQFAGGQGVDVELIDGSGLSRSDRATPRAVVKLLGRMRGRPGFVSSMPVAGVDGTLADRLETGPARGKCKAKTGTLSQVSALSGYCRAGKRTLIFSLLFDGVEKLRARSLQDKVAQAIAAFRP